MSDQFPMSPVLRILGRYDEAEPFYRRALEITDATLGRESEAAATLCHNLGGLEHSRGRHALGEPWARHIRLPRRLHDLFSTMTLLPHD